MENTSHIDSEVMNMVLEFKQSEKRCFAGRNFYNRRISDKSGELEGPHALFKVGVLFWKKGVFVIEVFLYKTGVWLHALSLLEELKQELDISGQKP